MLGAGFGVWVAHIPAIKETLALSDGHLSLVLLGIVAGAIAAMPLASLLTRRLGARRVIAVSAGATCAFLPTLALAPSSAVLVAAATLYGFAFGGIDVALNTQATRLERDAGRPLLSTLHGFFSLGGLLGAAAGGAAQDFGVRPICTFLVTALLLGGIVAIVRPHLLADVAAPSRDIVRPSRWPRRSLLVLGALALLGLLGEGAMADWSAVYLRQSLGTDHALAAFGFGAYSLAMAAGRFGGDRLVATIGPATCLRLGGGLVAFGLVVALASSSPTLAITGFCLVGLGLSNGVPILFSAAAKAGDPSRSSERIAVVAGLGYVGFLIGPPVIGFVADVAGLRVALSLVVLTGAALAVFAGAAGGSGP